MNSFNVGGVTNVAIAIYDGLDKEKYSVDFIRNGQYAENDIEKTVKENGSKVYTFTSSRIGKIPIINYRIHIKKLAKEVLTQIGDKKYDVIHIHAHASLGIYIAKKLRIPVRILHFHEAIPDFGDNVSKSKITAYMWKKRQKHYNKYATVKAGDSLKACKVKYGEKVVNDHKLCVLYPPIDMEKFNPSRYKKEEVLKEFSINKKAFNIIHVGRLTQVKNQKFIIDVLKEINGTLLAELYFVGDGECKKGLEEYAKNLGVSDRVHFLSPSTSLSVYLAMNCSLLPSFSEAFGMVAVESQLMGVKCYASSNVPRDVDIGGCEFLDLKLGAKEWARQIISNEGFNLQEEKKLLFEKKTLVEKVKKLYED